jgi:cyclopropane-fatty-acyl-phospholipid synthase
MFSLVTSDHRVRLDLPDGEQCYLGPVSRGVEVALRPPGFWQMLWILMNPGLRAGEAFMRGDWNVTEGDLATFIRIIQLPRDGVYHRIYNWLSDLRGPVFFLRQYVATEWNRRHAVAHYDAGDDLYDRMLDATKQYSCAFFSLCASEELEAAQRAKAAASITRLRLDRPHLKVLDIGCGWGYLATEIAQSGNHKVIGITISAQQLDAALARRDQLEPQVRRRVNFTKADYRHFLSQAQARYDRIVSIGMFEHVGRGHHVHFFQAVGRSLTRDGRALIHSIVRPSPGSYNEWIRRYVFPGSFLPSLAEFISAAECAGLIVDAVHVHPPSDYRKTIQAWRRRFETACLDLQRGDPEKYNPVFARMWRFYLAAVETIFTEDFMNFRIAQLELRKAPNRALTLAG